MVAVLEKIKLIIQGDRFIDINNPFGEKSLDYICENTFIFEKGKIYGIVCEHGGGGESISLLLSNEVSLKREKIYNDECEKIDKMVSNKIITKEKGEKLKVEVKENLQQMKRHMKRNNK